MNIKLANKKLWSLYDIIKKDTHSQINAINVIDNT